MHKHIIQKIFCKRLDCNKKIDFETNCIAFPKMNMLQFLLIWFIDLFLLPTFLFIFWQRGLWIRHHQYNNWNHGITGVIRSCRPSLSGLLNSVQNIDPDPLSQSPYIQTILCIYINGCDRPSSVGINNRPMNYDPCHNL